MMFEWFQGSLQLGSHDAERCQRYLSDSCTPDRCSSWEKSTDFAANVSVPHSRQEKEAWLEKILSAAK